MKNPQKKGRSQKSIEKCIPAQIKKIDSFKDDENLGYRLYKWEIID